LETKLGQGQLTQWRPQPSPCYFYCELWKKRLAVSIIKRSVVLSRHNTSVSLEDQFWDSLRELADEANVPLGKLVEQIDEGRKHANLSSAIRLFVLEHFQSQSARRETLDALKRPPSVVSERLRSV